MGPNRRNLAQQFYDTVFPAFSQEIPSHLLTQCLKRVELLIAQLCPAQCDGFGELGQPVPAVTLRVDPFPGAGIRPTPIKGFKPVHHPREILRESQVAAREFFQSPYAVLSVVDRREKPGAQKIGQLACIDAVILVARFEQRVLPWIANQHLGHMRLEEIVQPGCARSFFKSHLHTSSKSVEKLQNRGGFRFKGRFHQEFAG